MSDLKRENFRTCPGCGRWQPPFLYDEGAEICKGCTDKGSSFTDRVTKPKIRKKKLTPEKKDVTVKYVKKRKPSKIVELGDVDQDKVKHRRMKGAMS